jgi:membrane associated rhomboid family serine protease
VYTSHFIHYGIFHLTMNMLSLWVLRTSSEFNSLIFFKRNVVLLVLVSNFVIVINFIMINILGNRDLNISFSAGFSGMLYGWRTFIDVKDAFSIQNIVLELIIMKMNPRIGWWGHLAGSVKILIL